MTPEIRLIRAELLDAIAELLRAQGKESEFSERLVRLVNRLGAHGKPQPEGGHSFRPDELLELQGDKPLTAPLFQQALTVIRARAEGRNLTSQDIIMLREAARTMMDALI